MKRWLGLYGGIIFLVLYIILKYMISPQTIIIQPQDIIQYNRQRIGPRASINAESTRFLAYFMPAESKKRLISGKREFFGHIPDNAPLIYTSLYVILENHQRFYVSCWIYPDSDAWCVAALFDPDMNGPRRTRKPWNFK